MLSDSQRNTHRECFTLLVVALGGCAPNEAKPQEPIAPRPPRLATTATATASVPTWLRWPGSLDVPTEPSAATAKKPPRALPPLKCDASVAQAPLKIKTVKRQSSRRVMVRLASGRKVVTARSRIAWLNTGIATIDKELAQWGSERIANHKQALADVDIDSCVPDGCSFVEVMQAVHNDGSLLSIETTMNIDTSLRVLYATDQLNYGRTSSGWKSLRIRDALRDPIGFREHHELTLCLDDDELDSSRFLVQPGGASVVFYGGSDKSGCKFDSAEITRELTCRLRHAQP